MKGVWLVLLLGLAGCGVGQAQERPVIVTKTIEYRHGETVLEGYLALPPGEGKAPGVLVIHAWKGIGPHERETARRLAELGYVGFALDMYGKGVRAQTREEASKLASFYRSDRELMRARATAGFEALRSHERVDPERIAALGFCFGGGATLELARSGADLRAAVSFHGNLDTNDPEDAKNIKGTVLVHHGAADPHGPMTQVADLVSAFEAAGVLYAA